MQASEWIRERREARGIGVAELAVLVGVNEATVWRWERGLSVPRRGIRAKLARRLGVSREQLDAALMTPPR